MKKLYVKWLSLITSNDSLIKKINKDKTTLEIVMILYDHEINNKIIKSTDAFLDRNSIKASRSKKISVIQNLAKDGIIIRDTDNGDKRKKNIKLSLDVKQKLKKYLE